jgi:hypothetical protein
MGDTILCPSFKTEREDGPRNEKKVNWYGVPKWNFRAGFEGTSDYTNQVGKEFLQRARLSLATKL